MSRKSYAKIEARYIGEDGSMMLKLGRNYDLWTYFDDYEGSPMLWTEWICPVMGVKLHCPYRSLKTFLRNWIILRYY